MTKIYNLENGDVITDLTGTPFVIIDSGYPVSYGHQTTLSNVDVNKFKTFEPGTILVMPGPLEYYVFTGYHLKKVLSSYRGVNPYQWNVPDQEGNPCLARDVADAFVRPTSYGEVHEIIGTSGCSHTDPMWDWSVMGVLETPRGKQIVYPGDWVILTFEEDKFIASTVLPPEVATHLLQGSGKTLDA